MLSPWRFSEVMQLLGIAGAIGSFVWGVLKWQDKANRELAQQFLETQRLADNRRIEATKPFLERQLKLYTEASEVAARIATGTSGVIDEFEIRKAIARFWQLYYGELALVENMEVEDAMVQLDDAINNGLGQSEPLRQ